MLQSQLTVTSVSRSTRRSRSGSKNNWNRCGRQGRTATIIQAGNFTLFQATLFTQSTRGLIYKTVRGIHTKRVHAHKSRKWHMEKKILIYKNRVHTHLKTMFTL